MKRLAVGLVTAFAFIAAGAQASAAGRLHVGALGGVSLSGFVFEPSPAFDLSKRPRATAGGLVGVDLGRVVSLEGRVVWERKAADWTESSGGVAGRVSAHIDYVRVPVLVRVAASPGRIRPYLVAGGEVSIKTGARLSVTISGTPGGAALEDDAFSSRVQASDLALDAGAGIEIPAGRLSLLVEGFYSHGFRDLSKPDVKSDFDSIHARTFRLVTGVRF
jgi:hypothetical protein